MATRDSDQPRYDEDLTENPVFIAIRQDYPDLYSKVRVVYTCDFAYESVYDLLPIVSSK
jgi:hypothetical protein